LSLGSEAGRSLWRLDGERFRRGLVVPRGSENEGSRPDATNGASENRCPDRSMLIVA